MKFRTNIHQGGRGLALLTAVLKSFAVACIFLLQEAVHVTKSYKLGGIIHLYSKLPSLDVGLTNYI